MKRDFVLIICGFGRCGSSLVMQMLEAGGYPVTGEYPVFEDSVALPGSNSTMWRRYIGSAVKVIDPHVVKLPLGVPYRSIWLDRNHKQQAMSQSKFAYVMMGLEFGREGRKSLVRSYQKDRPLAIRELRRVSADPVAYLSFEILIDRPLQSATALNKICGGDMDIAAMAAVVKNRKSGCYPTMMEIELLACDAGIPVLEIKS